MPSSSTDPERLLAAASRLGAVRDHVAALGEELLDQLVVLGDREVQVAVDGMLEQAADTVRAIESETTELHLRLANVARRAEDTERRVRHDVGMSPTRLREPR